MILQIAAANNSGNVGAVKSCWAIVVGVGIVLCKIVSANNSVAFTKSSAKGDVVKRNARIDDGDRLSGSIESVLLSQLCGGGGR